MAITISELQVKLGADTDQHDRKMRDADKTVHQYGETSEKSGQKSKGFFGGLVSGFGNLGMGVAGFGMLGGAVLDLGGKFIESAKSAAEEQVGIDRLENTLKNSVVGYNQATAGVAAYIGKQTQLAFADDQLRDSLNFLVGKTGDLTAAQSLQATAMDLARGKGITLEQATRAVMKADDDSIGMLQKLGIAVTKSMTAEENLAAIRQATAGQAQTYANSAAGAMERIQNSFGDAIEDIGGTILPKLTTAMGFVAGFISGPGFQQALGTVVDLLSNGLGAAFDFVGKAATTLAPIVQSVWNTLTSSQALGTLQQIGAILGTGIGAAFGFLTGALSAAWPVLQTVFGFIGANIGPILAGLAAALVAVVIPAFVTWGTTMLTVTLPALLATMAPIVAAAIPIIALGAAVTGLWMLFDSNFLGIKDIVSQVWATAQPIFDALGAGIGIITSAFGEGGLGGALAAVPAAFGPVMEAIGQFAAQAGPMLGSWAQSAWTAITGALPGILSALGEFAGGVISWIGENAGPIAETLGGWAMAFINWVGPMIGPAMSALGEFIGGVLNWVGENAGPIAEQLGEWAKAFWEWISPMIGPAMEALGGFIGGVFQWVGENGPKILETLGQWAKAFVDWIVLMIPPVMQALGTFLTGMWTWITENGPKILEQLGTWAKSFVDWIGPMIGPAMEALGTFIGDVFKWIGDNGPTILGKLGEWALAFIGWIVPMIPGFLVELGKIAWNIQSWIIGTALPTIIGKLIEWGGAFIGWIAKDVLPQLPGKLMEIATGLWTWITKTAADAGPKLMEFAKGFYLWVVDVVPKLATELGKFAQGIWTWITTTAGDVGTKVLAIGQGIVDGIRSGISAGWDAMIGWLSGLVKDNLPQFIKDWLGIASPSKVMIAIFEYLPAGAAEGISRAWHLVDEALGGGLTHSLNILKGRSPEYAVVGKAQVAQISEGFHSDWPTYTEEAVRAVGYTVTELDKQQAKYRRLGEIYKEELDEGFHSDWPAFTEAATYAVGYTVTELDKQRVKYGKLGEDYVSAILEGAVSKYSEVDNQMVAAAVGTVSAMQSETVKFRRLGEEQMREYYDGMRAGADKYRYTGSVDYGGYEPGTGGGGGGGGGKPQNTRGMSRIGPAGGGMVGVGNAVGIGGGGSTVNNYSLNGVTIQVSPDEARLLHSLHKRVDGANGGGRIGS